LEGGHRPEMVRQSHNSSGARQSSWAEDAVVDEQRRGLVDEGWASEGAPRLVCEESVIAHTSFGGCMTAQA